MTVRQVHLSQGSRRLACWVEARSGVKIGNGLTLKGKEGVWKIESAGSVLLDKAQLNTKWNVGGLF